MNFPYLPLLLALLPCVALGSASPGPPNILWIVAEDMSPTLGCYGDDYARTPYLDAFARDSVRYSHAFAAAPVCSPSRSCLITGVYPVTTYTHQMRSAFPLPGEVRGFPCFLRQAGYFCTNNVKTDYNCADAQRLIEESWDESSATAHWRHPERGENQSFFAVFNDMTSHQSRTMVWPYEVFRTQVQSKLPPDRIHDPDQAPIPPYYPDTPVIRRTVARYYDCVSVMDANCGALLKQLEQDGLAGDTIVCFYSDHGSGMPRHKRNLHDSGMRVPLMIRFPPKYQHLAPASPGSVVNQLVSFVDFAPTFLRLAGAEVPDYMQGKSFLAPGSEQRQYVYGFRDRIDEVFDMARSVRDDRYLYIRNYMPFLSYHQPSAYPDAGKIRQEITSVAADNPERLKSEQYHYAGPVRPVEEFYDCQTDPDNIRNLAGEAEYAAELDRLRDAYLSGRSRLRDAGYLPEEEAWNWVRTEQAPLAEITAGETARQPDPVAGWAAADQVGRGDVAALLELLSAPDAQQRYWGILGLRQADFSRFERVKPLLSDPAACVRIETASWLASRPEYRDLAVGALLTDLRRAWSGGDLQTALRACRAVELSGDPAAATRAVMRRIYDQTRHGKGDGNLFLAFSAGAYLAQLGEPVTPWDFGPRDAKITTKKQ